MMNVAVLELNELNFEAVKFYANRGDLPNFAQFLREHGYCETTAEIRYAELEPWIQWVTVHTGKSFAEHGIFRLGDAVASSTPQIWEWLEQEAGVSVGAVSPMNAANRLTRPAFFVPDPWTPTRASGSWLLRALSRAVSQAVNDNASGRLTWPTVAVLLIGLLRYARPQNYSAYLSLVLGAAARPWNKVSFLDLFLSDLYVSLTRKKKPRFSTLFVNGAAHLQHHYLLNSPAYRGGKTNPAWYLGPDKDPVGEICKTYDRILGSIRGALPTHRILLMTGLHQEPYPNPMFYWRLRDHADFLRRLGVIFREVQPRMSRDFIVAFDRREYLEHAKSVLLSAEIGGEIAFSVEDRNKDLFVELVFSRDVTNGTALRAGAITVPEMRSHVVFVALKNGHHNRIGYFSDSGRKAGELPPTIPLTSLYGEMISLFHPDGARHTATQEQSVPIRRAGAV